MRNTKKKGKFTLFVYPEKPNYFVGVCLEFDLIQEGKSASDVMRRIKKASLAYLMTVIKKHYSDDLLNKPAPDKYWKRYLRFLKKRSEAVRKIEKKIGQSETERKRQPKLMRWDNFVGGNLPSAQDVPYNAQSLKGREFAHV